MPEPDKRPQRHENPQDDDQNADEDHSQVTFHRPQQHLVQERLTAFQTLRDLHDYPSPFIRVQRRVHGARQRRNPHRHPLVGRVEKTRFAGFQRLIGHRQVRMPYFGQPVLGRHPVEHVAIGRQLKKFQHQVRLFHG
ncbi:hypothetical protein D3C72_609650 [compost metagenome]